MPRPSKRHGRDIPSHVPDRQPNRGADAEIHWPGWTVRPDIVGAHRHAERRWLDLPAMAGPPWPTHRAVYGELSPFVWTQTAARLRRLGQTATTPHGLPHPDSLRGPLERACKAAGVPHVTPHQLRHSAGSIALAAGATTRAIMDMLGHSDHRTAVGYQHVAPAVREGTAAQLDAAWGTAAKASADSEDPPTDGDDDS